MDFLFPSDNPWGVPVLDPDLQPRAAEVPWRPWGSVARSTRRPGTVHFYVDDYRFTALVKHPDRLPEIEPAAVVEPNISVYEQTPAALALHATYQKRWLARYWQTFGLPVWVDLNLPPNHLETGLLGVPRGWTAYATRGYDRQLDWLDAQHEAAIHHAGGRVMLCVVGGGAKTAEYCQRRRLTHIPYAAKRMAYSLAG